MAKWTLTTDKLHGLMQDCIAELKCYGIPVSDKIYPAVYINRNWMSRVGQCEEIDGHYFISISSILMGDNLKTIKQTLLHELIHTCPDCMNHGEQWQKYVGTANKKGGYNIKRTTNSKAFSEYGDNNAKYIMRCKQCNIRVYRYRMSKLVKSPNSFRCSKCGGDFERLR